MADQDASLEQICWRSPPHVQMLGGFLHSNNILFYFAESPFFDKTSNNSALFTQATMNPTFFPFIETREAFEGRLNTMQGLQFVVAFDPLQAAAQSDTRFAHEPSNVWVVRKQNRRKDGVSVISTYFIVGDCIYMAPSVASVVGNRILSAVTSLSRLMKTASTLPTFTPSYGHTYMPPKTRTVEPGQQASQQSKENTPMPDAGPSSTADTQSESKAGLGISTASSSFQDTRSLADSFNLFTQYGDEYMDETPLVGEPGSFILSRAGGEAGRSSSGTFKPVSKTLPDTLGNAPTGPPGRVSTPQVRVDTPGKASDKSSSPPSSGENKVKRKKSRVAS